MTPLSRLTGPGGHGVSPLPYLPRSILPCLYQGLPNPFVTCRIFPRVVSRDLGRTG